MAIVLINTEESYDLDAKFATDERELPVPVVLVKKKTGQALLKQVERYERDVEASIEGEKVGEAERSKDESPLAARRKERGKDKNKSEEKGASFHE